ncbi:MAG TPA: RCC1 repeat-containing protein [Planctomycetota bacterium]|nr:RCC1 repeat-containing protein [Planctomycetota bacterium]
MNPGGSFGSARSGLGRGWDLLRLLALVGCALLAPACGVGSGGGTLTPTVSPQIPENVTAKAGNGSVTISWSASPAATSYTVQRSMTSGGPYSAVSGGTGISGTSYKDIPLTNGRAYYYVVFSSNAFGQSQNSLEVRIVPGIFATRIVAGSDHSLALLADGSLWAWGANEYGQLGNGSPGSLSSVAVQVPLAGVVDFSASIYNSMAVLKDGSLWTWGENLFGELGVGGPVPTSVSTPEKIGFPGGLPVAAVSSGIRFDLALGVDGSVWGWGSNTNGQLGTPATPTPVYQPTAIPGISGVSQISAGNAHALALTSDGRVWAWGDNSSGQLGNGTTVSNPIPQPVPSLTNVVAVCAGIYHSLALGSDGTVWAWGGTIAQSQWGTATPNGTTRPTLVPGLSAVQAIGAGTLYSVALRSDGTVWTWGANGVGVLGIPGNASALPVQIPSLTGIESISGGQNSIMAIEAGGFLWGWGDTYFGQLGNGASGIVPAPTQTVDLTGLRSVGGGSSFSVAATSDKSLWSWGKGMNGQLGDGLAEPQTSYRVQVASPAALNSPLAVATGELSTLVLNGDGTVWSWGYNLNGCLGNGSSVSLPLTTFDVPAVIAGLSGITLIAAGGQNGFAVGAGGNVWGWGYNGQGNAGCSSNPTVLSPTQLPGLSGITAVAAGSTGGLAVGAGGAVWTWGWNTSGQLGIGTTTGQSNTPVQIPGLSGVIAVGAGSNYDLALRSDGTVWGWGDNSTGQMGAATSSALQSTPVQIPGLSSIVAIAAGYDHGMALASDGSVWTWGNNSTGQLGNGLFTFVASANLPAQVPDLTGVISISAGQQTSLAIRQDGTLWSWGSNNLGELGIGSDSVVGVPTLIVR